MILDGQGRFDLKESTVVTLAQSGSGQLQRDREKTCKMISNAYDFACIEASRCYLTEREHGLRLSLKRIPKKRGETTGESYQLELSKNRDRQSEWYVQLETTSTDEGIPRRSVTFRHSETGRYLHSTSDGVVSTQSFPSLWTTWLMEPVTRLPGSPSNFNNQNSNVYDSSPVYYALLPRAFAPRKLTYTIRSRVEGGGLQLTTTESGEAAVWELQFTSGELCFMSNPVIHAQIRCNLFGQLSLSSSFQGWEVFRFIEVGRGNIVISSWTHSNKYISSDPDGKVFTSENRAGHWEKWRLEKAQSGVYIVSVAHPGRYLSIGKAEGDALHTTTKPGDFAKWHLDAAHSHVYYISISDGTDETKKLYVSNRRKGPFVTKTRRDWEEWKVEHTPEGFVTFWSPAQQKFLGSNAHGEVHTTSTMGDWSMWEMEDSPHGGVFLKSKSHHRALAVVDGNLCTTENSLSELETFQLEPRLPATISGPRLAALGMAGAVGVALTVAMPFAVLGAMEAAGLAATQLSVLAGVSAEALAGVGGGALIGAGVVGGTASMVKDETTRSKISSSTTVMDDALYGVLRPISAWRKW